MKSNLIFSVLASALLAACGGGSSTGDSSVSTSQNSSSTAPPPALVYGDLNGVYEASINNPDVLIDGKVEEGGFTNKGIIYVSGLAGYRIATAYTYLGNEGGGGACFRLAEFSDVNAVFNSDVTGDLKGTQLTEAPSINGTPQIHANFNGEKDGFTWLFNAAGVLVGASYTDHNVVFADKYGSRYLYAQNDRLTLNVGYRLASTIYRYDSWHPKSFTELQSQMCPDLRVHPKYVGSANYVGLFDTSYFTDSNKTIKQTQYMNIDNDGMIRVYQLDKVNNCFNSGIQKIYGAVNGHTNGKRLKYDPETRSLYAVVSDNKYHIFLDDKGFITSVGPNKTSFYEEYSVNGGNDDVVLSTKKADVSLESINSQLCVE